MRRFLVWLAALYYAAALGQSIPWKAFDRAVLDARLERCATQDKVRYANLKQLFEEAGCTGDRLREQPVKRVQLPNLICELPGETGATIVVGAHFDHLPPGDGAADNWSGAALLPSLYQGLATSARSHHFTFVGFTAEETGLHGSAFFVRQLTPEQVSSIRAMVNLDTLGLASTKVEVDVSDKNLLATLSRVAKSLKLPLGGVNAGQVGSTDSASFRRRKIPTVSIHSITQEKLPIVHSGSDNLKSVDRAAYYDTYRLVAAYLAVLDATLE